MRKRDLYFLCFTIFVLVLTIINSITSIHNTNKQRGYFTGKIKSIELKDAITIVEVSPVSSKHYFISEIKANHQIEYELDIISISGISDPRKKHKILKLGELEEHVTKYKVGDTIIFQVENKDYDENEYNLRIDNFAVDLTLE